MTDRFAGIDYAGPRFKGKRLGTIWYSTVFGEADVTLSPLFDELNMVMKLDVLRDAIKLLEREYNEALKKYNEGIIGRVPVGVKNE